MFSKARTGFADTDLNDQYKKIEAVSLSVDAVKWKLSEKVRGSQGKAFCEALLAMSSTARSIDDTDLSGSLSGLVSESARLMKMFEMLHANFNAQLSAGMEVPLERYGASEVQAVRLQKKRYEKASAALEAAVNRLTQLKVSSKKEPSKLADAEAEYTRCKEQFDLAKEESGAAMSDAMAVFQVQTVQMLCGTLEAAVEFFQRGHQQFSEQRARLEQVRQLAGRKRTEYYGSKPAQASPGAGSLATVPLSADTLRCGPVEKRQKDGSKFSARFLVLKWRYLLMFEKDDCRQLRNVLLLRGAVLVTEAPAQPKRPFCVAVRAGGSEASNRKEWVLSVKSKADQDAWIVAISGSVDRRAGDRKAATYIELGPASGAQNVAGHSVADAWTHKGGKRQPANVRVTADARRELLKQLILEERQYVTALGAAVSAYQHPLRDDPANLKREVGIADDASVFSCAETLLAQHRDVLRDLQLVLDGWPEKSIGQFFLDRVTLLQLYVPYVSNFPHALYLLERARKQSRTFEQFLKTCRAASVNEGNEELDVLLAQPLNRLTQYRRFLHQLVSMSTASDSDEEALAAVASQPLDDANRILNDLCETVAASQGTAADLARLIAIGKTLEGYDGELLSPNRRLIKECALSLQQMAADLHDDGSGATGAHPISATPPDGSGSSPPPPASVMAGGVNEVTAYLFSDQLVLAKKQGLLKDRLKVVAQLRLLRAQVTDAEGQFSFVLTDAAGRWAHLLAPSVQEKQEWMTLLQQCISEQSSRHFFGTPLPELMAHRRQRGHDVPVFLEQMVEFLSRPENIRSEGLFRLSGQASVIDTMRETLDCGQTLELTASTDAHVVAGLLKLWLRELPEPVFTWDLYEPVMQLAAERDVFARVTCMRTLLLQLPPTNRYVLQHLFKFLHKVTEHSSVNKMASKNLAIVFAPNLLASRRSRGRSAASSVPNANEIRMLNQSNESSDVIQLLIDHYGALLEEIERDRMDRLELLRNSNNSMAVAAPAAATSASATSTTTTSTSPPSCASTSTSTSTASSTTTTTTSPVTTTNPISIVVRSAPALTSTNSAPVLSTNARVSSSGLTSNAPVAPSSPPSGNSGISSSMSAVAPSVSPSMDSSIGARLTSMRLNSNLRLPFDSGSPPASLVSVPPIIDDWKEGDVVKQGWLEKKNSAATDKKLKWESHFFVLRPKYLVYLAQPTDSQPLGKIRLSNCTIEPSTRNDHCITIKTPLEKAVLAAKSEAEKQDWLTVLLAKQQESNPALPPSDPQSPPSRPTLSSRVSGVFASSSSSPSHSPGRMSSSGSSSVALAVPVSQPPVATHSSQPVMHTPPNTALPPLPSKATLSSSPSAGLLGVDPKRSSGVLQRQTSNRGSSPGVPQKDPESH